MKLTFAATIIHWRGPSPFYFAAVPAEHVGSIRDAARRVSYGWGMIPVEAVIAGVTFNTALFAKDDTYLLPIKAAVRNRLGVTAGDRVDIAMTI